MKLTLFSDYALRTLLYAAAFPDSRITIEAVAEHFDISRSHLKKVVLKLSQAGFLRSSRGRTGGFELARTPAEINLGAVLRVTEPDFALFECFQPDNACVISCRCDLPRVANAALRAFIGVFDRHTLVDVVIRPELFFEPMQPGFRPVRGPDLTDGPADILPPDGHDSLAQA